MQTGPDVLYTNPDINNKFKLNETENVVCVRDFVVDLKVQWNVDWVTV